MELAIKSVILLGLIVAVLVVLGFFITSQSSGQISAAEVNRMFSVKCQEYRAKNCDWSVTKDAGFQEFLGACRSLHGDESEAYACLYVRCSACGKGEINRAEFENGLNCAGLCERCRGDSQLGIRSTCCQQFASQCSASRIDCSDACP